MYKHVVNHVSNIMESGKLVTRADSNRDKASLTNLEVIIYNACVANGGITTARIIMAMVR